MTLRGTNGKHHAGYMPFVYILEDILTSGQWSVVELSSQKGSVADKALSLSDSVFTLLL